MHRSLRSLALLSFAFTTACGSATPAANAPRTETETPIELTLRTGTNEFIDLGELRDAPTFVFLFATYDELSQAAVLAVSRFRRTHPEVHVVGIAAQPDAAQMLEPYALALNIDFPLTYEPEDKLLRGETPLGRIEGIPGVFVIDRRGVIVERAYGFQSEGALERMLGSAEGRREQ